MQWILLFACIAMSPIAAAANRITSVIGTESGAVRGEIGAEVASWKGIPYAAPPVGTNRWRAPQPIRWQGVRNARRLGHDCMQLPFRDDAAPLRTRPSEDCLVLNVWRPAATSARPLPVMVWIYGGGYVNGGSSPAVYDGSQFARRGIVFVSFNYRLGRFGYFAHPALQAIEGVPQGNFGLMDQIAALRWVRQNIAHFGGDPDRVTLFGESAGGASTLILAGTPAARGLFQQLAVMSGGGRDPIVPLYSLDAAQSIGLRFASRLGIDGSDGQALEALRALPAERIVDGLNLATLSASNGPDATFVGGPILDGALVTGTPEHMLRSDTHALATIIGSNGDDIGWSTAATPAALFAPFAAAATAASAAYDTDHTPFPAVAHAVAMDALMTESARFVAAQMAAAGAAAYYYRFDYVAQSMRAQWRAAPHASDIPYFFDTVRAKYGRQLAPEDAAMARTANAYFANFAVHGDPNAPTTNDASDQPALPRWQRFVPGKDDVLQFTPHGVQYGPDPWKQRLDLTAAARSTAR